MLDKAALETLQRADSIAEANKALTAALPESHAHITLLHKDFALETLEKHCANRFRFSGHFSTSSIDGFTSYAKNRNAENSSCFINTEKMNAQIIFNIGDEAQPGHCDNKATLQLQMTAPYRALLSMVDKKQSQKDIAEFIEDWRALITASSEEDIDGNRENISVIKAIHAIRKITIEAKSTSDTESRNFGATSSTMESIDVKSADMPPAYLHFNCEPYLGLPQRTFDLRLSVITSDRFPSLVLRIVQQEAHIEQIGEEFEAIINSRLGELDNKTSIFIGNFSA